MGSEGQPWVPRHIIRCRVPYSLRHLASLAQSSWTLRDGSALIKEIGSSPVSHFIDRDANTPGSELVNATRKDNQWWVMTLGERGSEEP